MPTTFVSGSGIISNNGCKMDTSTCRSTPMVVRQRKYPPDEFDRRGQEIYQRDVVPRLRPEDDYKFVEVDIDSGDFEIDERVVPASNRLLMRRPEAQIWTSRVGQPATYRMGGRRITGAAR